MECFLRFYYLELRNLEFFLKTFFSICFEIFGRYSAFFQPRGSENPLQSLIVIY